MNELSSFMLLLNTCQEEFEGAADANLALAAVAAKDDFEGVERGMRLRTLGTVWLISELSRRGVVHKPNIFAGGGTAWGRQDPGVRGNWRCKTFWV
jgi:hypothetical protein